MEQNLAAILQRFERTLERMAETLDDIHECLEQVSVEGGEAEDGRPLAYLRTYEIAREK